MLSAIKPQHKSPRESPRTDGGREKDNPQVVNPRVPGRAVILDSVTFPYDELVGQPGWHAALRDRMKAQHLEENPAA